MSEYEYAVMYPRVSDTEPHRGPYSTRERAQRWIDEAVEDGFVPGGIQGVPTSYGAVGGGRVTTFEVTEAGVLS